MTVVPITVGELDTNCYLVYDRPEHAFLVDPGAEASRILQTVAEHHATVHAVLLTHAHFDHILATEEIANALQAPVYIHADDGDALQDGVRNLSAFFGGASCHVQADHLLRDGDEFSIGDMTIRVWHTPGHTVGGCCYEVLGHQVLLSGDTLFCRSYGRTDFPGGSYPQLKQSIRRLAAMEGDVMVYPGHGPATTLSAERLHNPILQDV